MMIFHNKSARFRLKRRTIVKNTFFPVLSIFMVFLHFSCSGGWQGRMYAEDGVEVTENTGRSVYGAHFGEMLQLRETLVLGGEEGPEEELFSMRPQVAVDDDLNIYTLDSKARLLRKYDSQGKLLWQTGREGQGPGEFMAPSAIALSDKGGIHVLDQYIAIQEFDTDGIFQRITHLARRCWDLDILPDGRLFLNLFLEGKQGVSSFLYTSEGRPLEPFTEDYVYGPQEYFQGTGGFGPDKARRCLDGSIYFSLPDRYEIREYTLSGRLERVIRRSLTLEPFGFRQQGSQRNIHIKDRSGPCFLWRDGMLINVMTRSRGGKVLREWRMDFFDRDGRFLGSYTLPDYRFLKAVDREGNLYFVESLPYPRLIRCEASLDLHPNSKTK